MRSNTLTRVSNNPGAVHCVGARPQACRLRIPFRRRAFASTPTILGAPQASTRDLRPECHPHPGNGSSNQFFHLNFSPTR